MLPELNGRCREMGYCCCEGRNGCRDDNAPKDEPTPAELAEIRRAVGKRRRKPTTLNHCPTCACTA